MMESQSGATWVRVVSIAADLYYKDGQFLSINHWGVMKSSVHSFAGAKERWRMHLVGEKVPGRRWWLTVTSLKRKNMRLEPPSTLQKLKMGSGPALAYLSKMDPNWNTGSELPWMFRSELCSWDSSPAPCIFTCHTHPPHGSVIY